MNNGTIEVHFTHPRTSVRFTAELSPDCTGQDAIDGLMVGDANGPFLDTPPPGRPYELVLNRTGNAITPNTTFNQAGVISGDTVEVRQPAQGA